MKSTTAVIALFGSAAAFGPKAAVKKAAAVVPAFSVDTIPGALAPVGLFDPLGFAAKADEATLKRYREAELTHGRVAMLAVSNTNRVSIGIYLASFLIDHINVFFPLIALNSPSDSLSERRSKGPRSSSMLRSLDLPLPTFRKFLSLSGSHWYPSLHTSSEHALRSDGSPLKTFLSPSQDSSVRPTSRETLVLILLA